MSNIVGLVKKTTTSISKEEKKVTFVIECTGEHNDVDAVASDLSQLTGLCVNIAIGEMESGA